MIANTNTLTNAVKNVSIRVAIDFVDDSAVLNVQRASEYREQLIVLETPYKS